MKEFVRKHPIWTGIIGVFLFFFLIGIFSDNSNEQKTGKSSITGDIVSEIQEEIPKEQNPDPKIESEKQFLFNVTYIVDGDTIEIETQERIRLICIDAPERGEEGYLEARKYLESLILNKKIALEKDISETDQYNRLLRYIYLENGSFINELVVKQGYAKAYPYNPDVTLCSIIQEAENYAKNNKLGIWNDKVGGNEEQTNNPNKDYFCDCSGNLYNCSNFSTHEEAQSCFELCGGTPNDIHDLDRDSDGIACEDLP